MFVLPEYTDFWQVSEIFRTARTSVNLRSGIRVQKDQQVVADVGAANSDVRFSACFYLVNLC